ncbi:unnamed protein product [Pedinophyceae sp. YPF-701]|nr:unnamed protein product [Pedinophyceae sp. YPF-701]
MRLSSSAVCVPQASSLSGRRSGSSAPRTPLNARGSAALQQGDVAALRNRLVSGAAETSGLEAERVPVAKREGSGLVYAAQQPEDLGRVTTGTAVRSPDGAFDILRPGLPGASHDVDDVRRFLQEALLYVDGGPAGAGTELMAAGSPTQADPTPGRAGGGGDEPPDGRKRSPDYFANVGDAIRTLREDIPVLFDRELDYDIYRDDVVFRDPRNCFKGMDNYKLIFWSLRFHGRIFFRQVYVEVKRIWSPQEGVINMRWRVHATPRGLQREGTFDGVSQYKLDSKGKIYEHYVDNVVLRDPPTAFSIPVFNLNLTPKTVQSPGGGIPT